MTKRNKDLERNVTDLEAVLKSKEADLRDHTDRAQRAELEALKARHERSTMEEKVIFVFFLLKY